MLACPLRPLLCQGARPTADRAVTLAVNRMMLQGSVEQSSKAKRVSYACSGHGVEAIRSSPCCSRCRGHIVFRRWTELRESPQQGELAAMGSFSSGGCRCGGLNVPRSCP